MDIPKYYKPKDCQHPSKVFGSTSRVSLISIRGLADVQLSSAHTQNEPTPTHFKVLLCRGTIYQIYVNIIGDPFSFFDFSVRGPNVGHVTTCWFVTIARAHVARFTRSILLNLAPAWQACLWKHRPSSLAPCVATMGPSRVGRHK